jgi:acyl-CoA synthetase (AMP-forming)/AMP-acid ligase II
MQAKEMLLVRSGGSTGNPKQMTRPLHTWVQTAHIEAQVFGITPLDRFAVLGDPQHSLWAYAKHRAQQVGAPCWGVPNKLVSSLKSELVLRWMTLAPTVVYGVPELVVNIARRFQRLSRVEETARLLLLGGGAIPTGFPETLVQAAFPNAKIWSFYGSAEASFIGYGSLGEPYRVFPAVELAIREWGEIWVRSPMTVTPERWVETGDLGRWVSGGAFEVLGRTARQLSIKGEKHVVEPLEMALMRQFGVSQLALLTDSRDRVVCALTSPTGSSGRGASFSDVSSARYVPMPREPLWSPSLEEINATLRRYCARPPAVRRVEVLEPMQWPLTPAGKTNFSALKALIERLGT